MNRVIARRLRQRLLWGAVIFLTLLNIAAAFALHNATQARALAGALREAEIANDAFAEETLQMFRQIDLVTRGIRAFYQATASVSATETYIGALQLGGARIENGYLVDADGRLVITHNVATVGRSVAERDYFKFHQLNSADVPYVSMVEVGRATDKYLFRVTRRIDGPDGQFAGVSLVTVSPDSIGDFYSRLTHDDGSVATLISTRDRRLRARVPAPTAEAWTRAIESPLWAQVAQSSDGRLVSISSIDGVRRHFVFRTIPDWEMVMVTGVPEALITQRGRQAFTPIALGMVGANLVLFVLAGLLSHLAHQQQQLRRMASTDSLTELPNRRDILLRGTQELARALRYGRPMSLLMIDIDHFKAVNDCHGHASGDRVLQAFAKCGVKALRALDHFGRVGGEEFLALLPETDEAGALQLAQRFRLAAATCDDGLDDAGKPIAFTVSIGIATLSHGTERLSRMVARADAALYRAKQCGRDRVELAKEDPAG